MDISDWEDDLLHTEVTTAIVRVKQFSNVDVHKPLLADGCEPRTVDDAWWNDYIDYIVNSNDYAECHGIGILLGEQKDCRIFVNPNVIDSSHEGHISLECYLGLDRTHIRKVELTFFVSVIDAEGRERFPQSFTFCADFQDSEYVRVLLTKRNPFFMSYVSRRVIQSDTEQLLLSPDDTLTLRVEVVLREHRSVVGDATVYYEEVLNYSLPEVNQHLYLLLDSPIAQRLRVESEFFDRIYATPMVDCVTGWVKIHDEMHDSFRLMLTILFKRSLEIPHIVTFENVLSMYAAADFYCVPSVLDSCRRWLRLICSTQDHAEAISRYAELYNDDGLKAIAEDFSTDAVKNYIDDVWTVSILPEREFAFELRSKGLGDMNKTDVSNSYL